MSSKTTQKFTRKPKLGIIYHDLSGLVIRDSKDKTVIGFYDSENEEYHPGVNQKVADLCEQYNFKYDESLVQTEEETENVEETEDTEEVTEETEEKEETEEFEEDKQEDSEKKEEVEEDKQEVADEKDQSEVEESEEIGGVQTDEKTNSNTNSSLLSLLEKCTSEASSMNAAFVQLKSKLSSTEESNKKLLQENEKLTKELASTKNKMKALLASMQENL